MARIDIPSRAVLKMARASAATDGNGDCTIEIKIPGTPGSDEGRFIEGGQAWFETADNEDWLEVHIVDNDDLLGYGAGTVVDGYTDTEVPSANQGWFIPKQKGYIEVIALAGMGWIPAGLYLQIKGHKDSSNVSDTLRVNFNWGPRDDS
jgi:hypothetical protein